MSKQKPNEEPSSAMPLNIYPSALPRPSLILGLDPPTPVTGDTHLRFGRLALFVSHEKHLPSPTFPPQPRGKMDPTVQINP